MKKTILDKLAIYLFRKFQYTKIMAVNMCQPKHFIIGNITKRLMRFGNQKMITEKILLLLENKKLRESMGAEGKLRANENYAWDKKVIEYLDAS